MQINSEETNDKIAEISLLTESIILIAIDHKYMVFVFK